MLSERELVFMRERAKPERELRARPSMGERGQHERGGWKHETEG